MQAKKPLIKKTIEVLSILPKDIDEMWPLLPRGTVSQAMKSAKKYVEEQPWLFRDPN